VPPEAFPNELFHPHPKSGLGYMLRTRLISSIKDLRTEPPYLEGHPAVVALADIGGARSIVNVPMVKDDTLIGVIGVYRQDVQPFSQKEVDLVQGFASQAVIAVENARLLKELRESLEQQTATNEILVSLSGSMTDTKPVFDAIVRNLSRLFGASYATVHFFQEGMLHLAAIDGEPGFEKLASYYPMPLNDRSVNGRVILTKQIFQVAPIVGNPASPPFTEQSAREFDFNAIICAPMIREGKVIGAIATARKLRSSKPLPIKPSSLSRIHGFCMNSANPCNSRPRPLMFSKLSAARPSICRTCSIRWSNRRPSFVRLIERVS
jgi:GAF domain-containing protein